MVRKQPSKTHDRLPIPSLRLRHLRRPLRLSFPPSPLSDFPNLRRITPQRVQHRGHHRLRILPVGSHVAHHHVHRHAFVGGMPAVVIGRHADHGVAEFGFAS